MQTINTSSPSFAANFNSPKLKFISDDFFVNIKGYGRNEKWADKVKDVADSAVDMVRNDQATEDVLRHIAQGVRDANQIGGSAFKQHYSGVLRTDREGWLCEKSGAYTSYVVDRYSSYADKLNMRVFYPLETSMSQVSLSTPNLFEIEHGSPDLINSALDYCLKLSKNIVPKFIHQDVKPKNMEKVNSNMAEIRWILAHSTPWMRGSDAISNIFMRVLYKAIGIKSYPIKKGVSLDLEAYCTELKDYKKEFPKYFEKEPIIIE